MEAYINLPAQWFPRKPSDFDKITSKVLSYGEELASDHPGFTDEKYKERRRHVAEVAKKYKYGEAIPRIDYTEEETAVWREVYTKLKELYKTHACKQHNYIFPLLEQNCGYGPNSIPQLEDVSNFLQVSCSVRASTNPTGVYWLAIAPCDRFVVLS